MKKSISAVAIMFIFVTESMAQSNPPLVDPPPNEAEIADAYSKCKKHENSPQRNAPRWEQGFEACDDIETSWRNSHAAHDAAWASDLANVQGLANRLHQK